MPHDTDFDDEFRDGHLELLGGALILGAIALVFVVLLWAVA